MGRKGITLGGLAVVIAAALAFAGGAGAARAVLPTLNLALTGAKGVSVSGSKVSGAVSIVSTFSGTLPRGSMGADFGLVRLNPGVTLPQAAGAVQSHHGDLNALTPYAGIVVNANAPGTVQTVLTPGRWVALNLTGNGQPGFAPFTVTKSSSPASLPAASAIQSAIEFAFRGPTTLHNGTLIRAQNQGFLVHMVALVGARNLTLADARQLIALVRAGKSRQAMRLVRAGFSLLDPASPGALQQEVLDAKPGYYVETCFMDTQDGREHDQLGMMRVVKVV
jgi:hypothetical protein